MDNLHSVIRTIRSETKSKRDHLTVFREFLSHLDSIGRKTQRGGEQRKPSRPAVVRRVK